MQAGDQGVRSGVGQAEGVADRRNDQGGLADRGQLHEGDAAGKVGVEPFCRADRQPGLAHPCGPGQGQQPHVSPPQQRLDLRDFSLSTDQGRQRGRQRRRREGRGLPLGRRWLTRFGLIGKQPEHGLTSVSGDRARPRRHSRGFKPAQESMRCECTSHSHAGMRNLPHAVPITCYPDWRNIRMPAGRRRDKIEAFGKKSPECSPRSCTHPCLVSLRLRQLSIPARRPCPAADPIRPTFKEGTPPHDRDHCPLHRPRRRQGPAADHLVGRRLRRGRRDAPDHRRGALRGGRPPGRAARPRRRHRQRQRRPGGRPPLRRRDRHRLRPRPAGPGARTRAEAEGLPVDFREGDAEDLPFPDASFDVVLSTFGAMFAPDQEQVARELVRVCRPGGTIGMANWTPEGYMGGLFRAIGSTSRRRPVSIADAVGHRGSSCVSSSATRSRPDRDEAPLQLPLPLARAWIQYFRTYYGPTLKAFDALDTAGQDAARRRPARPHGSVQPLHRRRHGRAERVHRGCGRPPLTGRQT